MCVGVCVRACMCVLFSVFRYLYLVISFAERHYIYLGFYHCITYTHAHTLSWTTWLPAASLPASTAARDLARLIILLLIECRGTLQGWVIKLVQRMFVSTVYLSRAKRYIRHSAHKQGTHMHRLYWDLLHARANVNGAHPCTHSASLSLKHTCKLYTHKHDFSK